MQDKLLIAFFLLKPLKLASFYQLFEGCSTRLGCFVTSKKREKKVDLKDTNHVDKNSCFKIKKINSFWIISPIISLVLYSFFRFMPIFKF